MTRINMFKVIKELHFSYAHRLMNHQGKCKHLHGHNARVQIEVGSDALDEMNMVIDFSELREKVGCWIDEVLDHKTILWSKDPLVKALQDKGEPVVVMDESPTAESLARWIFKAAHEKGLPVTRVVFWETVDSCAVYGQK